MKVQAGYLTKKSGNWLGHFSRWLTDYDTGKKTRVQRAFTIGPVFTITKTKAREALQERVAHELGLTADSRVTLKWFIEHRWKPLHEGTWRESTKQTNEELLKVICDRFGHVALENADGVEMQAWLNALAKKRSGSVVKHLRIFLRAIMTEAFEQDFVRKNPARMLRVPKLQTVRKPFLSLEQVKALLAAATWYPRERCLLRLILVTALRPSELFALRWRCIDFVKGILTISETVYRGVLRNYTKTSQEGDVQRLVVPEAAVQALAEWHSQSKHNGEDDFIFPNSEGGFWRVENYQRRVLTPLAKEAAICHVLVPLAKGAEIPRLNFQILRRTVATHAQHLGSPKDIATIMRHRKVETAQEHYIQAIETTVKETGELLAAKMLQ
jgi:integrase